MADGLRKFDTGTLIATLLVCGVSHAGGPWRASQSNTQGWQLMTPEERIEHQSRVRGFTDYKGCEAYRAHHQELMTDRARLRGLQTLPENGQDFCDHLKPTQASPLGED